MLVFSSAIAPQVIFAQEEKTVVEQKPENKAPPQTTEATTNETDSSSNDAISGKAIISRSSIKIAEPVNQLSQTKDDLTHYLPPGEITPMLAGSNDFLTLMSPNLNANERGVAIILPDWHQSATDPKAANYLRQKLPLEGWTTITIQPKEMPSNYPSMAEKEIVRNKEDAKTLDAYRDKLASIMNSISERSKDFPGLIMVIAQGQNAVQLHTLYSTGKIEKPNVLVLLSAYMPTKAEQINFALQLSKTELATLDLILDKDHPLAIENAQYRQKLSNMEMKVTYRQRTLYNARPGYYPHEDLYRQINGWLSAIGW